MSIGDASWDLPLNLWASASCKKVSFFYGNALTKNLQVKCETGKVLIEYLKTEKLLIEKSASKEN